MAGNPPPVPSRRQQRPPRWLVAAAAATIGGLSAFAISTPFFSDEAAASTSLAVAISGVLVTALGVPSWSTLRKFFRPRRLVAVLLLILLGGVGHAFLFGKHAPAQPKLSPSACDDTKSVKHVPVPRGTTTVAMLEVMYSRHCRLFWAQVTPTTKLNTALDVTVGLTEDRGPAFGRVKGRLTTQAIWSDPARDEGLCYAAVVEMRTGEARTTVSTDCF